MSKLDTAKIRSEWADKHDSEMKRASLKLCDDYEKALKAIILNKKQAEELLSKGQVKLKKIIRYGDTL